jgi:hypothetical protein
MSLLSPPASNRPVVDRATAERIPPDGPAPALLAELQVEPASADLRISVLGLPNESADRSQRVQAALADLRDGYEFALSLGRDVWDFAVEIEDLQAHGLRANELRWLIFKGWVVHAHEVAARSSERRSFTAGGPGRFDRTSCFALTPAGARLLERLLPGPIEPTADEATCDALIPRWDQERQELRLADYLIKRFKVPANTQGLVLGTFQEEGWPARIDDPLPGHPEQDRKRRLHNTINALNRNQIHPFIRFLGDGRGEGIRWELTSQASFLQSG